MSPGKVKVNGTWRDVAEASVKVNGAWKSVKEAYTKVNGTWRQWLRSVSFFFGFTPSLDDSITDSVFYDQDANFYIAGSDESDGRPFIAKYNSNKNLVFGLKNLDDQSEPKTTVDSQGNLYFFYQRGTVDSRLFKYNSSGVFQWARRILGAESCTPVQLVVDSNDNLLGIFQDFRESPYEGFAFKITPNGSLVWSTNFRLGNNFLVSSIAVDSSNNIIVGGSTTGPQAAFVAKLNGSSGSLIWQRTIDSESSYVISQVSAATVDSSNNIYVSAILFIQSGTFERRVATIKLDSSGNFVWSRTYRPSSTAFQSLSAVQALPDGNIATIVEFRISSRDEEIFIVKYNPSGTLLFQRRVYVNSSEYHLRHSAAQSSNGISYVAESLSSPREHSFAFLPIDGSETGTYTSSFGTTYNYLAANGLSFVLDASQWDIYARTIVVAAGGLSLDTPASPNTQSYTPTIQTLEI